RGLLVRRDEVVGPVEVHGVDRVEVDEVLQLDRAGAVGLDGLELLGREHDVGAVVDLVALDDVVVVDLAVRALDDPLVAHPLAGGPLQLVEADALLLDGGEELHRHVHQPEAEGAGPDRAGHGARVPAAGDPYTWGSATSRGRCGTRARPDRGPGRGGGGASAGGLGEAVVPGALLAGDRQVTAQVAAGGGREPAEEAERGAAQVVA